MKQTEMTLKEPISELDKEILTLQINELQTKLNRRMRLCSYLEEELSAYRSLYGRKHFLKRENMRLLNETFRELTSEEILLTQECQSMSSTYSHLTERQQFSQERVHMLTALADELETNFLEYEKCCDEYVVFMKASNILEEKVLAQKNLYNRAKEDILREFDTYLLRIENEVNVGTERIVSGGDLRVDLLPPPWQILFQLNEAHLDSSPIDHRYKEDLSLFPFVVGDRERVLSEKKSLRKEPSQLHLRLENQNVLQRDRIRSLRREVSELEEVLKSLESHSHILHTVKRAGNILRHYFLSTQ